MNKQERAHEFALKVLAPQIEMLESAYMEGYADALSDKEEEESRKIKLPDNIEYHDFNLPSGKKWAFVEGVHISYLDQLDNNFNLPSKEDVEELMKYVQFQYETTYHYKYMTISYFIHSKYIDNLKVKLINISKSRLAGFWMKDEEVNDKGLLNMAVIHEESIEFEQYHQTHKNTLVLVK